MAMYAVGQARWGLVWALVVLQGLGLLGGRCNKVVAGHPKAEMKVEAELFQAPWVEEFSRDEVGCKQGRMSYLWRKAGFGSNINNLINAWVYGIVMQGWSDVAVVIDDNQLKEMECSKESGGLESHGLACIFSSMPHFCIFDSPEMWQEHLDLAGVSAKDKKKVASHSTWMFVAGSANIDRALEGSGVNQRGAKSAMTTFLWSYFTPWILKDVSVVTHVRETFESSPFIAVHIRRGDKLTARFGKMTHTVESYLVGAVSYLQNNPNGTSVDAIKGIWVASDDKNMVEEVRELAGDYFPSVLDEDIMYTSVGVPGGGHTVNMTTTSNIQEYESMVYLLADLEQLVAADVFVGACSSNLARLVMVLRDGIGKDEDSGISLDMPWFPNRQRSLVSD